MEIGGSSYPNITRKLQNQTTDWHSSWQFNIKKLPFPKVSFWFLLELLQQLSVRGSAQVHVAKATDVTYIPAQSLWLWGPDGIQSWKICDEWVGSQCDGAYSFISLLENWSSWPHPGLCSGQLQPMRVMLFVMRNLNREPHWGMTGMCFHWR